ncbi:MAG: HD domain-containing protein [Chloroflexi bacterium]|nr:HD domain-containing protein [Chloroflexota bacterium]
MPKDNSTNNQPEWRKAVRSAMQQATEQEIIDRFGGLDNASFNYRWEHVQSVVTLAMRLAEITGADIKVVEAAAWLHDVRKDAGDSHPREGAKFAREFLPQTNFPKKKIERVAMAIEDHMGLWRSQPLTNLESMVLWDADKLAKIGLTAAFHWTGLALAGNKFRALSELIERGRSADWQAKTVASMHTEPARRAAQSRLEAYNWLWNTLEAELNGSDLER